MGTREKSNSDLILSIDAGTQSIRAALIDLEGEIRGIAKTPMRMSDSPQPGWAEQDPEYFWDILRAACAELFAKTSESKDSIRGVAVTTQRNTVIDVDKNGSPLRPAIVWLDERKADSRAALPPALRLPLKILGIHTLIDGAVKDCESKWIRQNQPEIWERVHKHIYLSGWFNLKLTGEFSDSSGSIVGYTPFSVKKGDWAGKFDPKSLLFPIEREKLPDLVKPTGLLGHVTRKASEETGIPAGLPVIAAANDKACEILGAGCVSPENACVSFGTISTINTMNDKYVELKPLWPPYPSAIPGKYYTEVAVQRGAWMITWFKEEFGLQERLEASEKGVAPEQLLDALVKDIPPGAMGLTLQPYWTPTPDKARCARGSVIGFCDFHKRAHLYRSILEGLVFALKEGAQLTEKKNKIPITGLRVSGGGSQSSSVMQICADVFGMPAQRPRNHETSALGAAIDAAVGLGFFNGFNDAVAAMTRPGDTFEPIAKNVALYSALYDRVYTKIYEQLLPIFKEMQQITGYPEKGC
ncbi:MAG: Xylulose kinase [bacterium ADurb.Bin236]|nr:MAG: Xylulose kinase [bacterium ADurb.Bin236]